MLDGLVLFSKRKPAYVMRSSDCSSVVCSSDLPAVGGISPAARRNSVDLPEPLRPTSPVLPVPKAPETSRTAAVPSSHTRETESKRREEEVRADMGQIGRASCRERVSQSV